MLLSSSMNSHRKQQQTNILPKSMDSPPPLMANNGETILVQEIAASLTTDQQVPERYIHKDTFPPAEEAFAGDLLIDFSRLSSEDELGKLRSALTNGRCIQVVNHGIQTEVLESVLEVSRKFFALPMEEKRKSAGSAGMYNGYVNDNVIWGNQTQNWNDGLYLKVYSDDPANLRFWPENPPELRKIVRELSDKAKVMPEKILKAIARSLGLEDNCFLKHNVVHSENLLKFNLYPPCPNTDKVLGFTPHSDGTLITILFQDQEGLQFMEDDRWYKIPLLPVALIVVVGDLLEILSNGRIKSTVHRVVTNPEKQRISVGLFFNPEIFDEIGPIDELVSADQPKLYKKTNIMEYGLVYRNFTSQGKRTLSAFKV